MTDYKLTKSALIILFVPSTIFALIVIAFLSLSFMRPNWIHHPPPLPVVLIWGGLAVWLFFYYSRVPYSISWMDDNSLEFCGLFRRTRVPVHEIISIKAVPMALGFIKINHRQGSIRLINQITGLYELIGRIKTLNPEVEIKGC